jgi:predicted DNA-binding transcriptional regulator AlpA
MTYELPNLLQKTAFLREKQLVGNAKTHEAGLLPFSRATLWRRVKDGTFPQPVKLSERTTAWPTIEVRKWMADPVGYRAEQVH